VKVVVKELPSLLDSTALNDEVEALKDRLTGLSEVFDSMLLRIKKFEHRHSNIE
jgi:hypothetical protein